MITAPNKVKTNLYLDVKMKEQALPLFKKYGFDLSDAFNIFLTKTVAKQAIPFNIDVPNQETIEAMQDSQNGIGLEEITFEQLKKDMKKCIVN